MPKMNLPPVNLDLTLERGKMKAITEAATGKSTEYVVRVDQLRTIPNFNVRVTETDDYRADLESLKQSIRENGYYANKPLAGYVGKDGDDDVIYVTDGHRRLQAVNEINEEALSDTDLTFEGLPVVLKPADSSIGDLTIALVQDNTGRPLTPYEMGVVVQRLANMHGEDDQPLYSKSDIARKLSITERYIDDLNLLAAAPAKVRTAVLDGSVASTLAIQELRRDPKKAEERLLAAVQKAKASGRSKATRKHVEGVVRMQSIKANVSLATGDQMGEVLKALAKQIRDVVPHSSKDEGDKLGVDGTITVTISIPAPAKAPAAPKAKKAKKAAKRTQAVEKPSKVNGGVGGAKKAPAAKKAGADADAGEPAKLPPKVPTVDTDSDPDNI